jgi:glycosyltransferase involved in cell wall biosynthesis
VHHVVDSLASGGAELLLAELAVVAPAAGIEMSVGYLEDRGGSPAAARLREVGVQPTLIPIPPRMYTSALFRVRRHLAEVRPDVVHTHLGASDVLAGLAARSLGIPSVSTVHSLGTGADAPATARGRARNRVYALGTRASAARLVAVSESARQEVLRRDGYAPERVVVINNGVARRPAPGAGPYVREQLGIGPDEPVVATLSTLRPVKGHEVAIAAMAEITRRVPGARLVVVGEGESRPALERAAAELGPVVKFAGFRDDVMPVLDAFDVLAHPSRQEAFPTTLLEAMAAGVPQVATAVGGIPEIVDDGRTGLLLPAPPEPAELAERVVRLLGDPELRARLAAAGRERFAERFGADAWAQRLRALYLEVLESR